MKQLLRSLAITACVALSFAGAQAQVITAERAQEIANSFFQSGKQKSAAVRSTAAVSMKKSADSRILTSESSSDAPTFHIITPASGEGFVIVAGEEMENPIIGYSFEGTIDINDLPVGFVDYMTDIDAQVKALRKYNANKPQKTAAARSAMQKTNYAATTMGNIVVQIETAKWGQEAPFNQQCHTSTGAIAKTGCVPTAYAIIMRHHQWPLEGIGNLYWQTAGTSNELITDRTYDWENMPLVYDNNATDYQKNEVAKVMRDLGQAYMVTYGTSETGVSVPGNTEKLKTYFDYNIVYGTSQAEVSNIEDWKERIRNSLDNNCPIPYKSHNVGSGDTNHIFVVDGYTDTDYFHFNFGWYGGSNGWYRLESLAPSGSDYTWSNTSDHLAIFNLTPNRTYYAITATPNNATYGTTTIKNSTGTVISDANGIASVIEGATVTLAATANTGYTFSNWTKGGEIVSTAKSFTVNVTEAADYVANFLEISTTEEVNINITSNAGGTVKINGTTTNSTSVAKNSSVTVTALPENGYIFSNWTDGTEEITTAEYTFVATGNKELTATFAVAPYYTITAEATAGGTATVNGSSTYSAQQNNTATLQAIPNDGYYFINWTVNGSEVSTQNPLEISIQGDKTYTANFANTQVTIKQSGSGGYMYIGTGTVVNTNTEVSTRSKTVNAGEKIYLRAEPSTKEFGYWRLSSSNGPIVTNDNPYFFTAKESATFFMVLVEAGNNNPVAVSAAATAGGSATITIDDNAVTQAPLGEEVTLKAMPTAGYRFVKWTTGSGTEEQVISTEATCTAIVQAATTYTANFEVIEGGTTPPATTTYTITATANPATAGSVTGGGTYNEGATVTLAATPNSGYTFKNWTSGTTTVSTNATYSFTANANAEYVANFQTATATTFAVTTAANPAEGGTATFTVGTGQATTSASVAGGTQVTLNAVANTGYRFVNWTNGTSTISSEATANVTINANSNFVANFEKEATTPAVDLSGKYFRLKTLRSNEYMNILDYEDHNGAFGGVNVTALDVNNNDQIFYFTKSGESYKLKSLTNHYLYNDFSDPGYWNVNANSTSDSDCMLLTFVPTTEELQYLISCTKGYFMSGPVASEGGGNGSNYVYCDAANTAADTWVLEEVTLCTITANSVNGGTVTPETQTVEQGTSVTLTATPADGYVFVNWTNNLNTDVVTDNPYTVTATTDVTYTANFKEKVVTPTTYTITATASPVEGGTVTGGGTYNEGETVTLTATPNDGYNFVNWTKGTETVSTEATVVIENITANADYVANFERTTYTVNVNANPGTAGTATVATGTDPGSSSIEVEPETSVTLTATPADGYVFVNWTNNLNTDVVTDNPYTVTATTDVTYTAKFEEKVVTPTTYTITATANPTEGGTVTGGGTYTEGETITLEATPAEGYVFVNWTNNLNTDEITDNPYTVTATTDVTYTANFEKAAAAGGGTETVYNIVTNSTNGAISEQNPNTNENYFYKVWTSGVNVVPQIVITSSGYTITAVTDNELKLRAATYTLSLGNNVNEDLQIVSYTINYIKNASSSNITLSAEGEEDQTPGETTELQSFVVDSFDPTRSTSFTVTTGNLSQAIWVESIDITIRSSVKEYTITATANPTEGGTVTGGGTYDDGAKATLTAMPNANYSFVNWTKDGAVVNNSATYEVTVTADANYVANFNYTGSYVSIAADISTIGGSEGGTVTGTGKAIPGSTVTLTAVPNTGYRFAAWYNGEGQQISTNASYSFEATEDATYRAEFIKQVYVEITQPETTNETGVVNGYVFANTWIGPEMTTTTKTTVDYGTEVILNVIVYDEFNGKVTFAYWSLNGEKVSQEDSYTFTATEDSYYFLANFDYKAYVAVEAADGNGSVRIKGEDGPEAMVAVNNTVTIIAEAESEYVLDRWVKVNKDQSETYVSGNATYTFVFKADYDETVTYKAYFRKIEMLENGKAYRIIGIMSNGKKRYVYCDGNQLKWSSEKVDTDNSIFVVQSDLTNKGGYINLISAVGYYGWQNNADMGNNYAMIKTEVDSETGKFTLFAANGTSCLTYCVYDEDVNATNGTVISRESQTGPTKEVNDYGTTDFIFEEALFEFNVNIANGSNAKLGTINLPFATIVHPSVTAYKVTSSDENWVYVAPLTLTDNILPANTPVLVEADEAGTYGFAPAPARIGTYDTGFEGTLAPEDIPGTTNAYILSYEREETPIKLYKLASDDRTINANKAYYIDENGGASAISFKFAGTTCIDGVEGEYGEVQSIYDLQGRKLSEITEPGIYIVNGKKIMVK